MLSLVFTLRSYQECSPRSRFVVQIMQNCCTHAKELHASTEDGFPLVFLAFRSLEEPGSKLEKDIRQLHAQLVIIVSIINHQLSYLLTGSSNSEVRICSYGGYLEPTVLAHHLVTIMASAHLWLCRVHIRPFRSLSLRESTEEAQ